MSTTARLMIVPTSEESEVSKPDREDVIDLIMKEARHKGKPCTRDRAKGVLDMLLRAAERNRSTSYARSFKVIGNDYLVLHPVLCIIMPDDQFIPPPGSAHELILRFLLKDNEFALVHTNDGGCVIKIMTESVGGQAA